ncbi:MAG: hypothetical protein K1X72_15075 [Pyrinomonadaceae bacterium]|nr:hypothetical protein [Pyrinomonadaceae bacterium]
MKVFINLVIILFVLVCYGKAQNRQINKVVEEPLFNSESIVKNAPFSAEAISENAQTLADGNKIKTTFSLKMYRDKEGRFRREGSINPGMLLTPIFKSQPVFHIIDPVDGVQYYLDITTKTARETKMKPIYSPGDKKIVEFPKDTVKSKVVEEKIAKNQEQKKVIEERVAKVKESLFDKPKTREVVIESDYVKTESLGTKTIEGVEVVGSRIIHGINAGSIGNEKPIEIVYERWFSNELQLIIFSKYYDPRYGEQTYRLTNLSRNNPEKSLFEVPKDYKIISQGEIIEKPKSPEKKPLPPEKKPLPIEKRP